MSLVVDVRKRLGDFSLEVSFELDATDGVLGLLGASGCGKSLTLRCIAGIERPDEGRIVLDGRTLFDSTSGVNLPPRARNVGYLFQQLALFPHMTVEQNVLVGVRGGSRAQRRARACRWMSAMRLEGLEERRPQELSGGQQQRCAMARMLASEPRLLLLDEPFSALDGYLRWQLELELADVLAGFGGAAVLVSHDRNEIYRLCDTVCVLDQGRAEPKVAVRELFARPTSLGAALISGCKNVSRAQVDGTGHLWCADWGVALEAADEVSPDVTHVGLRAHYLGLGEGPNAFACTVERVIDSTFSTIVMLRTPGGALLRMEMDKQRWAQQAASGRLVVHVDPACVMPLVGGGR